jgi:hypothetical protein
MFYINVYQHLVYQINMDLILMDLSHIVIHILYSGIQIKIIIITMLFIDIVNIIIMIILDL